MIESNEKEKIQTSDKSLLTIGEPKQYYVVMHNDDKTPFDFVVDLLMGLFNHDKDTAADLAHKIHTDEKAIVGINHIALITTEPGYYNDCTMILTDSSNNISQPLKISSFEVGRGQS